VLSIMSTAFSDKAGAMVLAVMQTSLWKRYGMRIEECEPKFCRRTEQSAPQSAVSMWTGRCCPLSATPEVHESSTFGARRAICAAYAMLAINVCAMN
jgi:hypothetical protein